MELNWLGVTFGTGVVMEPLNDMALVLFTSWLPGMTYTIVPLACTRASRLDTAMWLTYSPSLVTSP